MTKSSLLASIYYHKKKNLSITFVDEATYSYQQLFEYKTQLSTFLLKQHLQPGQKVMLLLEPSFTLIATLLACLELGVCVVLIDPGVGHEVFQSQLRTAQPDLVIIDYRLRILADHPILRYILRKYDPSIPLVTGIGKYPLILNTRSFLYPFLPALPSYIASSTSSSQVKLTKKNRPLPNDNSEAVVIFTSGTTGAPKGVVHTHASLAQSLKLISNFVKPKQPVLYTTQIYFLLMGIALGANIIFNKKGFSVERFLKDSDEYQPNVTFGPPGEFLPVILHCQQEQRSFPSCYEQVLFGSAPITTSFLEKFYSVATRRLKTTCLYGMTEVLPIAAVDGQTKLKYKIKGDLLGKAVPGVKARIDKIGQLLVSAPHQAPRYLTSAPQPEIATGDLVTKDQKYLVLRGRQKDMILRNSFNIYPALYESTIEKIPGVVAACLVGVFDEGLQDEKVYLVIEKAPTSNLGSSELMSALKSGPYAIHSLALPDYIIFRKLPRFGRQSKIHKTQLRQELSHHT